MVPGIVPRGRPIPSEYMGGQQCRQPIAGRKDNIPQCMPPIVEHLTQERLNSGRIGHFSSRKPLLRLNALQEGNIPWAARSAQPMLPGPMPRELYNRKPQIVEHADWQMVEQPYLSQPATHIDVHRRLHQDRGNYRKPVMIDEAGEPEVTPKPPPTSFPHRQMPTTRNVIENRIGFYTAINQANISHGTGEFRKEVNPRTRKGGETVNNRGSLGAPTQMVASQIGVQSDDRESLQFDGEVSGNPTSLNQENIVIDPRTFRPRDTRRIFTTSTSGNAHALVGDRMRIGADVKRELDAQVPIKYDNSHTQISGNAQTVNPGPWRLDENAFADNHPTNRDTDTDVQFGPNLRLGMSADRFQKRRTHIIDFRPEDKSDPKLHELNVRGGLRLFNRPAVLHGQETRPTQKGAFEDVSQMDAGQVQESLRENPYQYGPQHFYSKLQAAQVK